MAEVVQNFAKYERNTPKIAKYFKMLAKVAKFRQIWSHCLYGPLPRCLLPYVKLFSSNMHRRQGCQLSPEPGTKIVFFRY